MVFTLNKDVVRDEEYLLFGLNENVVRNENFGDQIGIREVENVLWLHSEVDIEDCDIINFLENFFESPINTVNFINRYLK